MISGTDGIVYLNLILNLSGSRNGMQIEQAQKDIREAYLGGFAGQAVSGSLWFLSAILATWISKKAAVLALCLGGMAIYPLTLLVLRALGRAVSLPREHPMNALAMQVAFTLPLNLPLVLAATLYRHNWFYPALMVALGAHYLPFVFLYGMRLFAFLSALLVVPGILIALYLPRNFTLGCWWTAGILFVFAIAGRQSVVRESNPLKGSAATR